ncbi:MAG: hypothetical protein M1135_01930 [Candidatus Omnitrophica bacterium]|jgi:uroporphyrinogen decarboxylase|nr:hypothetical protein [Candidatus Omnitrophota bacterium]
MTDKERFCNIMNYKSVDRSVYLSPGGWNETIERWKKEGFDPNNPPKFPKTDKWDWYGRWFYPNPPFEKKIISEDENTIVYINEEGITMREKKDNPDSSMPQFIRFPIETRQEYRKFMKEKMQPDLSSRIGPDYKEKLSSFKNREHPFIIIADRHGGFFGGLRALVGVEKACMLFYDDPLWVEEIMDDLADFLISMMDKILTYTDIDVFGFWEDMAFKTGPLVGPQIFRKFAFPRYKKVVDFLYSKGVKFISLDSDGNMSSLIPIWLDAGINTLYPFEVQCGMDVNKVRKEYGKKLRIWNGIDKRALAISKQAIDLELKRVEPLIKKGGYIAGPDHSLPPDVPYSNYLYYMEKLWELVNKI